MIKLIKKAEKVQAQYNIGDLVEYVDRVHDGRSYEDIVYRGTVVTVHKVNLDFVTENGNTYRVDKGFVRKIN
jgi:ribosomal protein L35AE/L33A